MPENREILAQNIRNYRKNNKINQFDFAEECGLSKEELSLIERCLANVKIDTLDLIAIGMDVTIPELFYNHENIYIPINTKKIKGIGVLKDYSLIDFVFIKDCSYEKIKQITDYCNYQNIKPDELKEVIEKF